MSEHFIIVFDLKINKQVVLYFETKEQKDKKLKQIKKYLGRYIIIEDSSIYDD